MNKKLLIFPFIIFFLILSIFFYLLIINRDPSQIPSALINKKVPIFKTKSLLENKPFSSENEFNGAITLVNFFATWCGPCREEHVYIKRLYDKKIKIIGINYKDDQKKTINWLNELGNPYSKVLIDTKGVIGIDWGVYGIPETFIVNSQGLIKYRLVGPITKKNYNSFYLKILEIEEK